MLWLLLLIPVAVAWIGGGMVWYERQLPARRYRECLDNIARLERELDVGEYAETRDTVQRSFAPGAVIHVPAGGVQQGADGKWHVIGVGDPWEAAARKEIDQLGDIT